MGKIMIIPDVHGRTFWKKILDIDLSCYDRIIFLGDLLDPYMYEFTQLQTYEDRVKFLSEDVIRNASDIIKFVKNHNNAVLLTGNHDAQYVLQPLSTSRMDNRNARTIKEMIVNAGIFKLAYKYDKILFTHAPLSIEFMSSTNLTESDIINCDIQKNLDVAYKSYRCSWYRGGRYDFAGPFWTDINEIHELSFENDYNICGHTQLENTGIFQHEISKNGKNVICVDSRSIFEMDTQNPLETLKTI